MATSAEVSCARPDTLPAGRLSGGHNGPSQLWPLPGMRRTCRRGHRTAVAFQGASTLPGVRPTVVTADRVSCRGPLRNVQGVYGGTER